MPEPTTSQGRAASPTWAERVGAAWDSWHRWCFLPGRFRMDRVLKDAGVRNLVVDSDRMREAIRAHYSAYMAGDDLLDTLNALAAAAGLTQQGEEDA